MNGLQRAIAGLSVVSITAGGIWLAAPHPAASPELQIAEALQDASDAAKRGSVDGVMEVVSDDFKSGVLTKQRLRLLLMRSQQSARGVNYDVKVTPPRILPAGEKPDERVVMSRLAVFDAVGGDTYWGADGLTFVMRKEKRRRFLFFTEPRWRVISVANLPPFPVE